MSNQNQELKRKKIEEALNKAIADQEEAQSRAGKLYDEFLSHKYKFGHLWAEIVYEQKCGVQYERTKPRWEKIELKTRRGEQK